MTTSRYLTPQKIGLLLLVNLYCDSTLTSSATVPVLSFVLAHLISRTSSHSRASHVLEHEDVVLPVEAFENILLGHASSMPGRTVLEVFLKRMWSVNSFDALHDLFNSLGDLLMRTREEAEREAAAGLVHPPDHIFLSRTSPLGAFIRRARLEFTRLQFHDAMKLWSAFVSYREPTAKWSRRIAEIASAGVDVVAADLGLTETDSLFEVAYGRLALDEDVREWMSLDDFDRLLEFQLDKLQCKPNFTTPSYAFNSFSGLGCRVPGEMKIQLRRMLHSSGVVLRQSHLLKYAAMKPISGLVTHSYRFFDAWKAGDYTSAFDNLHRYYDYAMQTREKIHYQYALLHMAILQADFGCFGEAIAAINETIVTARENQDMACLNFSLNWLSHMSKAYPNQMRTVGYMGLLGSERDGLLFLKSKAKETKMFHLLSATLLDEAKACLTTVSYPYLAWKIWHSDYTQGESIPRALEYMYQASYLNVRESMNISGSQMLLQSTVFSRLGTTSFPVCFSFSCSPSSRNDPSIQCSLRAPPRLLSRKYSS